MMRAEDRAEMINARKSGEIGAIQARTDLPVIIITPPEPEDYLQIPQVPQIPQTNSVSRETEKTRVEGRTRKSGRRGKSRSDEPAAVTKARKSNRKAGNHARTHRPRPVVQITRPGAEILYDPLEAVFEGIDDDVFETTEVNRSMVANTSMTSLLHGGPKRIQTEGERQDEDAAIRAISNNRNSRWSGA